MLDQAQKNWVKDIFETAMKLGLTSDKRDFCQKVKDHNHLDSVRDITPMKAKDWFDAEIAKLQQNEDGATWVSFAATSLGSEYKNVQSQSWHHPRVVKAAQAEGKGVVRYLWENISKDEVGSRFAEATIKMWCKGGAYNRGGNTAKVYATYQLNHFIKTGQWLRRPTHQ